MARPVTMHHQRGISLIITFLIMSVMLAIVLSVSSLLFRQVRLISNIGNSMTAFNAAESGWEKTRYIDRKHLGARALRGFCSLCTTCPAGDCKACQQTALAANGCAASNCSNCRISYNSSIGGATYYIEAEVRQGNLTIFSEGVYQDASRFIKR